MPERRWLLAALLSCTFAQPAGAQASRGEAVTAYGSSGTLRLKAQNVFDLEARLETRSVHRSVVEWSPVTAARTGAEGWTPFVAAPGQTPNDGVLQYLCDLPLGEARRKLPDRGSERWVRVTVRRSGAQGWLSGSWQGEFVPPAIGVKAWTYWLPSVPPPIQSTEGLIAILMLFLWAGCIAAVRAEAGQMGLEGRSALWRHAGWLHLPGAILFFVMHPAPPAAGIGRELAPPRRVQR